MANNWRYCKVQEIAKKVAMGPFGSSIKVSTFVSEGIPIISGQHLNKFRLEDGDYNYITYEHADKLKNANVFRGDIIFTHAGNINQVAYIPTNSKYDRYIISQRQFYLRCDPSKVIPAFIVYFFKTPEGQHKLLANSSPSGVPSIAQPVSYLKSIEIPVPPIKEQQAITCILGAIDDKIELNCQLNETYENLAKAIFKSWFEDYDPVYQKAQGLKPAYLKKEIADAFPDAIRSSKIGYIPKGWSVHSLSDVFFINPPRSLTKGTLAPYLSMSNMPTKGHFPEHWIVREVGSGMKFINGDTLVARITPCLENGKIAYVDFLQNNEVGWGSTEYIVIRPKSTIPEIYAYLLARTESFRSYVIGQMTGSSGRQRVPVDSLDYFFISTPDIDSPIFQYFNELVTPIFSRIKKAAQESNILSNIRDLLLSKLISGELRITEAEKIIGRAV